MLSLQEWIEVAKERVSIDDALRWLGNRRPMAFVWYGLFLIELSIAALILSVAYELYIDNTVEEFLQKE
jgi:hypothetical protein